MLSRVAESLFWTSRYIERAENTARLLDVNFHLLLDLDGVAPVEAASYWQPLVAISGDREAFAEGYGAATAQTVTDYLVFDRGNANSVFSCITNARENARSVIEVISSEMWEQINRLYHFLKNSPRAEIEAEPYHFYSEIKTGSHLFQGITDATMTHGEGWDFIQAGKFLERADNTSRIVDVKYHLMPTGTNDHNEHIDDIQWMAVLKSVSALEAFRKVYASQINPRTVAYYILLDRTFPRSVYFSAASLQRATRDISGSPANQYTNDAERLLGKLVADLSFTTIEDIYTEGLHEFLNGLQARLGRIGQEFYSTYFSNPRLIDPIMPYVAALRPPELQPVSGNNQQQQQQQQDVA